jgi:hypothetical protein
MKALLLRHDWELKTTNEVQPVRDRKKIEGPEREAPAFLKRRS